MCMCIHMYIYIYMYTYMYIGIPPRGRRRGVREVAIAPGLHRGRPPLRQYQYVILNTN